MAITNFTDLLPLAQKDRIIAAFCAMYNRPKTVKNVKGDVVPNPETEEAFTNNMIKRFVKEVACAQEANVAAEATRKTALDKAATEIIL